MKSTSVPRFVKGLVLAAVSLTSAAVWPGVVQAQVTPPQRVVRTYIPPDQLVSFLPSTPFGQFVEFLNPIFERVTGKQIVDPESRSQPIGIAISGMHFLDAFELVLEYNGLTHRESEDYFIVQQPEIPADVPVATDGTVVGAGPATEAGPAPATAGTREVRINAVLFDLNQSRARELGIDWNQLFGGGGGASSGSTESSGSSSGGGAGFAFKTEQLFADLDDWLSAPEEISFSKITQIFRFLEREGLGETIANPQISVQSGEQGRIQIGSDVPVQTRDFAGNTVTQFFSTGIIVDVTPTVLAALDSISGTEFNFVHLDVLVENSASRPSEAGIVIDRNRAESQVLLLDGEQTVIGGLYSTEEVVSRRGIPILKDLPGWFFGLRYIFGYTTKNVLQRELLIALQAEVVDPLHARVRRPLQDELLDKRRENTLETLDRFDEGVGTETRFLPAPGSDR